MPGNTPIRGPRQVQNSFQSNNQVRPDLTLFSSASSKAVYGNLLTLPIGTPGCSTSSRSTSGGSGENTFPLLQKVLVNYADRIGYANTLSEALDQVFGAGAGQTATDSGGAVAVRVAARRPRRRRRPTPTTESAADAGGAVSNPAMDQAVADIDAALVGARRGAEERGLRRHRQAEADLQRPSRVPAAPTPTAAKPTPRRPRRRPTG